MIDLHLSDPELYEKVLVSVDNSSIDPLDEHDSHVILSARSLFWKKIPFPRTVKIDILDMIDRHSRYPRIS